MNWPDCEVENCEAKCCRAIRSRFCFPHTVERISEYGFQSYINQEMIKETLHALIALNCGNPEELLSGHQTNT